MRHAYGVSDSLSLHYLVGPVPARYVRQSQLCPQLDVSDKNDKRRKICPTELDMSDKNCNKSQICPTELDMSDKNYKKTQDMSDRARYVRQK